jgi:hypothetical protein
MEFIKDKDGNWYLDKNKFYLGTQDEGGEIFQKHLLDEGYQTVREMIDGLMMTVNSALTDAEENL